MVVWGTVVGLVVLYAQELDTFLLPMDPPQDSIAVVVRSALTRNRISLVRLNLLRKTSLQDESWPIRWKVDFPISTPLTLIVDMLNLLI